MKGAPKSDRFDDIYFSAQDGLAETRHVFMQGNDLPTKWQGKQDFVIAETGFGTGLNFLCVWQEFERTCEVDQRLHFISFEKHPLAPDEIREALKPWADELGDYTDRLVEKYPLRVSGFHRIIFSKNVVLTLIFGDVNEYIPQVEAQVDCWFLDGFTPAKNPDMWSETLYQNMARLSKAKASVATFTAAGDVRRGLQAVGFDIQKVDGFGNKRNMVVGLFKGDDCDGIKSDRKDLKVAIIGGGLAGTSCAYILKQYGLNPVIYEASNDVAQGASGNDIGLINPRFSALKSADSEFYSSAFAGVLGAVKNAHDVDYNPCGTLHLINSPEKEKRFSKLIENWDWHEDHIQILSQKEASDITGIDLNCDALYLPNSATVSPRKLCHFYAKDVEVILNHKISSLSEIEEDIIILACGAGIKSLLPDTDVPIHTVRGQVSYVSDCKALQSKTNICYGGYISASYNGVRAIGSSFQKWLEHTDVLEEDNADNIQRLKDSVASLEKAQIKAHVARAGLRVSSHDRFPIAGKVPAHDNVYISTAHGSHGIVSSYAAAHLIADEILCMPYSLPQNSVKQLNLQRFTDRAAKKSNKKLEK